MKEGKNARKKRKRREAIDKAADDELAEITLEQQVLRELSAKSQQQQQQSTDSSNQPKKSGGGGGGGGKRSAAPISLNIADMITALEVVMPFSGASIHTCTVHVYVHVDVDTALVVL